MAFVMTLGFATEHDRADFIDRIAPRVRGHVAEPDEKAEEDGLYRIRVSVTSQTAARDVCHMVVAFLAHSKKDRVNLTWTASDGSPQAGIVTGDSPRDAEILAVRVGAAAKNHLDAEKAAEE